MEDTRVKPLPTNTALARLMQRIVDVMPGATVGTLRKLHDRIFELTSQLGYVRRKNQRLEEQVNSLYADLKTMLRDVPGPVIDFVTMVDEHKPHDMSIIRTIHVTYQNLSYASSMPDQLRRDGIPLSVWGAEAIQRAANKIAYDHAAKHAQYIIDATMRQGAFKP